MTHRRILTALIVASLAAVRASGDDGLRPGETVRETDAVFPGAAPRDDDGADTVWPVRIVDALTGRPISGAVVKVPNHVQGGATPEDVFDRGVGKADADGWVRLPTKDVVGWRDYVIADAPGYAATEHCDPTNPLTGEWNAECALVPGTDVPIVLLDYTGRPVAGARIALNLGCGHIPDQRTVTTDAKGRAVLPSIYPSRHDDIWIEAPGLHRGTTKLSGTWRPGNAPVAIHASPGIVVEGRVLTADGKPVKGAAVGAHGHDRPWVHTDATGRFRLGGVLPWNAFEAIDVFVGEERETPDATFFPPPEGVVRTVTIGDQYSGSPLTVTVRGPSGEAAAEVRVTFVRPADGVTATAKTDAGGATTGSLPPGRYDVLVDGELGTWGSTKCSVEWKDGALAKLDVTVPRNPTVRVDASRVRSLRVDVATTRQFRELLPDVIDGHDVPVPADGRATFRVAGEEDGETLVRFFDVPAAGPARDRPLVFDWVPQTKVTAHLVGPDGAPTLGRLKVVRERGRLSFNDMTADPAAAQDPVDTTHLAGTVDWIVEPVDKKLGHAFGTVVLPETGGSVDLGKVRLAASTGPAFRVEIPPELAGEDATVSVHTRRCNFMAAGILGKDGTFGQDLSWIGVGEQIAVTFGDQTIAYRTQGPPPWVMRWPAPTKTSLSLRVVDEANDPVADAVVVVDGVPSKRKSSRMGALTLEGLAAGAHDVVVAERGHAGKAFHLVLRDGEARELEVRLAARK